MYKEILNDCSLKNLTSQFIKVWIETCIGIRLQWGFLYLQFHAKRVVLLIAACDFFNQVVLSTYNNFAYSKMSHLTTYFVLL